MSTVSITPNDKHTQINVFTLHDPANQQKLVDIMSSMISGPGKSVPGFIATALHRSVDGTKVVVYSQWSTKDAAKALGEMEEMKPYMKQAFEIAAFTPTVCEVVGTFEGPEYNHETR